MNSCEQLTVPILFLIFNRPQETARVFAAIRSVRPRQLFIAADGPRISKIGEAELCEQTRSIAAKIDWPCEVKTLFRTENLGCGPAVSSAISWFFEQVEEGIILEDDCVPHESFFEYCSVMLEKYRDDERIMMINGISCVQNSYYTKDTPSYFFSRYYAIWGWATWRRAWQQYDFTMKEWYSLKKTDLLVSLYPKSVAKWYEQGFDRVAAGVVDTWDAQWAFACMKQNAFAIAPMVNLVANIGYVGVHYNAPADDSFLGRKIFALGPIKHPNIVVYNQALDLQQWHFLRIWEPVNYLRDSFRFIRRCLRFVKKLLG